MQTTFKVNKREQTRLVLEDVIKKKVDRQVPVDLPDFTVLSINKWTPKFNVNLGGNLDYKEYEFEEGGYTFRDLRKATITDSYARLMVDKFSVLTLTDGYHFTAKRGATRAKAYIENRIAEMELVHDILLDEELEIITRNLYQFSNAFIHVIRDQNASSGRKYKNKYSKKTLQPIAAIEALDVTQYDVSILADEFNNKIGYRLKDNSSTLVEYPAEDIIHLKLYPGKVWGHPIMISVIDDIVMLRRIEENAVIQSFQHANPKLIYKVPPARPGSPIAQDSNVVNGKLELEAMLEHGGLVTTTDCDIEIPSATHILDLLPLITHAKSRVLSGLHMSQLMMGEGDSSNKSTANVIVDDIINQAQYTQKILIRYLNKFIINRLLLESKTKSIRDKLNQVTLFFDEIDITYASTLANLMINQYNSGVITLDETRDFLGYTKLTPKEKEDLNPARQMTAGEAEQNTAPDNQHEKKYTTTPRSSVNDGISFDNKQKALLAYIDDSNIPIDVKQNVHEYVTSNSVLLDDETLNTSAKATIKTNLVQKLVTVSQYIQKHTEKDNSISSDFNDTYIKNALKL